MVLLDTNSLLVLVLGIMNPKLIASHKRTSIYEEEDFYNILELVGDFSNIVVLPNTLTEVDNLLNNFTGERRFTYVQSITLLIKKTSESFVESKSLLDDYLFFELGLTDSAILSLAKACRLLITSDSALSDQAHALGVPTFDLVAYRNLKFSQ